MVWIRDRQNIEPIEHDLVIDQDNKNTLANPFTLYPIWPGVREISFGKVEPDDICTARIQVWKGICDIAVSLCVVHLCRRGIRNIYGVNAGVSGIRLTALKILVR